MKRKVIIIISLSLIFLMAISLSLGFYFASLSNNLNIFIYEDIKKDEIWEYDPYIFSTTYLKNDSNPEAYDTFMYRPKSKEEFMSFDGLAQGNPFYDENGIIQGFIGISSDPLHSNDLVYNDLNQTKFIQNFDSLWPNHEVQFLPKYKKILFIGKEFDILELDETGKFYELNLETKLPTDWDDGLNTYLPVQTAHSNSFDIYGENMIISSRNFGMLFSFKVFDEEFNLLPIDEAELNWVLPGNGLVSWYMEDDSLGNHPLIKIESEYRTPLGDQEIFNYIDNPNYTPTIVGEWKGKIISPFINGEVYDFNSYDESIEYEETISNDYKFWGQHTIRILNKYFENNPNIYNDYNSDNIYISINDNHNPSDISNYTPYGIPDIYSYHTNRIDTNPWNKENDAKPFTKIIEINPNDFESSSLPSMSYRLLANVDVNSYSEYNQFSNYQSSSLLFTVDKNNYIAISSNSGNSLVLLKYSNLNNGDINQVEKIYEVKFNGNVFSNYRAYPLFENLNDITYGWNSFYL